MVKLRKFQKNDTREVASLVADTYRRFNSTECTEESAAKEYINYYNPRKNTDEQLYANFLRTPIFYVVVDAGKIIGMIRGRPERISNLFVDGRLHKKGVGTLLLNAFEAEAKRCESKQIKLRASLYAIPFYEKMGYKKTTGIRTFHGLKACPMKKRIN
jgi:GNAT superfamily N-acetyltransferase